MYFKHLSIIVFLVFLIIFNNSCSNNTNPKQTAIIIDSIENATINYNKTNKRIVDSAIAAKKINDLNSISCDSCLHLLLLSSEIETELKNKSCRADGIENNILLLKIYHENEAEPGAYVEAVDAWLNIDLTTKKLLKVMISDGTSLPIKCDEQVLNHYISHCVNANM